MNFQRTQRKTLDRNNNADPHVQEATPESLRIEIDNIFKDFLANPDVTEYKFTSNLNNLQRKYIHEKAKDLNLQSKSYGKEPDRQLHIKKKRQSVNLQSFCIETCNKTNHVLNSFFTTSYSRLPTKTTKTNIKYSEKMFSNLINISPTDVQPCNPPSHLQKFKENLPIFPMRNEIVTTIRNKQIVIISSETGSGKTTQIPQYILDDMRTRKKRCKIVCTQPRRISTVGVAERVAEERGDFVGRSVGYHIRLEQKYGPQTNLIYCTIGVMLRVLMNGEKALKNLTHIIIDEIHERDRLSDFLLICLKKSLHKYPDLRVILMSATVNIQKFCDYFDDNVAVLSVPGRLFPIQEFYLDDILHHLGFVTPDMRRLMCKSTTAKQKPETAEADDFNVHVNLAMDDYLEYGNDILNSISQLEMNFVAEDVSVNYQHSITGMTALMIASLLGDIPTIERLCNMGADLNLRCKAGKTCFNYANDNSQYEALQLLCYIKDTSEVKQEPETQNLLSLYDKTHSDDMIDFELITSVIEKIQESNEPGGILVFLPGYDDIMLCNDHLLDSNMKPQSYKTFFLHGSMSIKDQYDVFKPLQNCRKIILSTNIAETSITIDDVVFVIDCGKAKEKTYDSYNKLSSLETLWISKACAKQRAGRAGRTSPGRCYHLYSRQRYEHFDEERVPEILRTSLDELCLHTKILAPNNVDIREFLSYAPDPPSPNAIKASIENLESLGAIDEAENLTALGEYLAQLSIDPRLGKMLIYSVIFKCLDPILTLVSVMAHKDPFQLPPQANLRTMAAEKRKALTNGVLSDHLVFLKAFDKWQEESCKGSAYNFCREYFISQSTMDVILETRRQLLSQLRAAGFVPLAHTLHSVNVYSKNWPLIKAVIASGLYPLIAYPNGNYLSTKNEKKVFVANTSVLNKLKVTSWLVYDELVKNKQSLYIKSITAVTPFTIALTAGNNISVPSVNNLVIDDWLDFEVANEQLIQFRLALDQLIVKMLANPTYNYSEPELELIKVFNYALQLEDEAANFVQINDVGSRPRFYYKRLEQHQSNRPRTNPNYSNTERNNGNWRTEVRTNQLCDKFQRDLRFNQRRLINGINGVTRNNNRGGEYRDNPIFVLIKPRTMQNIQISYGSSKWVFAPHTEKEILKFAMQGKTIYLVFSVNACESFNGIARYVELVHVNGGKPTAIIQWIHKYCVPFGNVCHLTNSYNNNRSIFYGKDGQVIEQSVGQELLRIYEEKHGASPSTSHRN